MYSKKCSDCGQILNNTHLKDKHGLLESNTLISMLRRLQEKNHGSAMSDLKKMLQMVSGMARTDTEPNEAKIEMRNKNE